MGGGRVETSPLSGNDVFLGHKQMEVRGRETKTATRGSEGEASASSLCERSGCSF